MPCAAKCFEYRREFPTVLRVAGQREKNILTEKNLAAIDARVRNWHDIVVRPLRAIRQDIKTMPEMDHDAVKDLRKNIARIELWAEQIEQTMLFEAACTLSDAAAAGTGDDAARRNVTALLQRKRLAADPPISELQSAELLIAAAIACRL